MQWIIIFSYDDDQKVQIMSVGLLVRGRGIGKQNLAESSPCLVQLLFLPERAKIKNLKKIFIKFVRTKGSRQVQVKSRVQLQTEESRARQTQKIQDSEVELCKTE